jgi:sulfur carrier protein
MQLIINGETQNLPEGINAGELIERLGLQNRRLALEVNLEIVPRGEFSRHVLQPGDRVEIVQAIGGG